MGALGRARKVLGENVMVFKGRGIEGRKEGEQVRLKEMGDVGMAVGCSG